MVNFNINLTFKYARMLQKEKERNNFLNYGTQTYLLRATFQQE